MKKCRDCKYKELINGFNMCDITGIHLPDINQEIECYFWDLSNKQGVLNMIYSHPLQMKLKKYFLDKQKEIFKLIQIKFSKKDDLILNHYEEIFNLIHKLTKFNIISTEKDCGGYLSWFKKEIAMNQSYLNDPKYVLKVLLHELGHYYQWLYNPSKHRNEISFVERYEFEQEAEAFTYHIINNIRLNYSSFKGYEIDKSYFGKYAISFSIDQYGYDNENPEVLYVKNRLIYD